MDEVNCETKKIATCFGILNSKCIVDCIKVESYGEPFNPADLRVAVTAMAKELMDKGNLSEKSFNEIDRLIWDKRQS